MNRCSKSLLITILVFIPFVFNGCIFIATKELISPDYAEIIRRAEIQKDLPFLIKALEDKNKTIRRYAAIALGEIKNPRAVEPLIAALKDEDIEVRREAAWALGEIKDTRAIELLITALRNRSLGVLEVTKVLGKIDPNWLNSEVAIRVVPDFIAALKDKDVEVRRKVAWALEEIKWEAIKSKGTLEAFIQYLQEHPDGLYAGQAFGRVLAGVRTLGVRFNVTGTVRFAGTRLYKVGVNKTTFWNGRDPCDAYLEIEVETHNRLPPRLSGVFS